MKIEHIAVWAKDIEKIKSFYEKYFNATSNKKYENTRKYFSSYFLNFDSGSRMEIMHMPSVQNKCNEPYNHIMGYAHIAISVGSIEKVNAITSILAQDGYVVIDGPRKTGDGYYESIVLDPENNRIEITV